MMNTIELNNISFSFNKNVVFNQLSIKINEGMHTTILGTSALGKTTLKNIFENKLNYEGKYLINDIDVKTNRDLINQYVGTISLDMSYYNESVVDMLFDVLSNFFDENSIETEVNNIKKFFNINNILGYKIDELSDDYKYYVLIISELLTRKKFIVIDDLLCFLKDDNIKKIYEYASKNNITIIDLSSTLNNILYSDYLICLYNKNIAIEGNTIECLKEERLFKRLGYNLPFIVDLSIQLNYYNIIDKIYTDRNEMVNKVWK